MIKSEDLASISQLRVDSRNRFLKQSKNILSAARLHLRRQKEPGLSHRRFYSVELLIFFICILEGAERGCMSHHEPFGYDGMTSRGSAFPTLAKGACGWLMHLLGILSIYAQNRTGATLVNNIWLINSKGKAVNSVSGFLWESVMDSSNWNQLGWSEMLAEEAGCDGKPSEGFLLSFSIKWYSAKINDHQQISKMNKGLVSSSSENQFSVFSGAKALFQEPLVI